MNNKLRAEIRRHAAFINYQKLHEEPLPNDDEELNGLLEYIFCLENLILKIEDALENGEE